MENELDKNAIAVFTIDNAPGAPTSQVIKETVVERYLEKPDQQYISA